MSDLHWMKAAEAAQAIADRKLSPVELVEGLLARVESIAWGPPPEGARRDLVAGVEIGVAVEAQEIGEEERRRLQKELAKLETEIGRAEGRLADEQFLAKAPAQVVATGRAKLAEMKERRDALRASLGA